VRVFSEKRHLTFRIATIGAVRLDLDEFPDCETIRGFDGGNGNVFAHELVSVSAGQGAFIQERGLERDCSFSKPRVEAATRRAAPAQHGTAALLRDL
jgi:hypothetical protein